jgi:tight adherence protein B
MSFDLNFLLIGVVGILVAFASWSLLYGLFWLFAGREAKISARIKRFVTEETRAEVSEAQERRQLRANLFSEMDARIARRSFLRGISSRLEHDLEKANLHITQTEFLLIQVATGLALAIAMWLAVPRFGLILAFVGFVIGLWLARAYLRYMGSRRIRKFEDQLPDTLSILANSVRGGFSLFQALQLIARESAEPSKTEFLRVIQEISLGSPMDDALHGLSQRIPTEDVDILVTAVSLQHQTGGNLSHVLDVVANTVRERHRVEREIRGMTAQQRFSASLLAALPFVLALVIWVISPAYIGRLFEWSWVLCMPVGAVIMTIIGLIIMRRLATIDV